jgi:AcrR family transcriptional regulator
MGIAERREREKEQLRTRILEAARDLLSEQGLGGLSMRAIAERIEYSPATIYLYFKDKSELVHEVVQSGFVRMGAYMRAELAALPETATAAERYGATGRAYARFAIENTAYFRVMFELPAAAELESRECPDPAEHDVSVDDLVNMVKQATREGSFVVRDPRRTAIMGWGIVHGLTSLYLSGHLTEVVGSHEEFMELVEEGMQGLGVAWKPPS